MRSWNWRWSGGWCRAKCSTDATHLKANANKNKFDVVRVEVKPQEYLAQMEQAIEEDRVAEAKRELKAEGGDEGAEDEGNQGKPHGSRGRLHGARGQAEGVLLSRPSHGGCPARDHHRHACDAGDSARLGAVSEATGSAAKALWVWGAGRGVGCGYTTTAIANGLEERGIYGVTGYRQPNHGEGLFPERKFRSDAERDV
jgi:hypothetical protein